MVADLEVRCKPESGGGALIFVQDEGVKGVGIDELEHEASAESGSATRATHPAGASSSSPSPSASAVVPLSEYLDGLRNGVTRAVSGHGKVELARFLLPLLTSDLSSRLKDAECETKKARESLQRLVEVSDPSRAQKLATSRDYTDAVVQKWRADLQRGVDSLCSSIADVFSQEEAIDGSSAHIRNELTKEAENLRHVASNVSMGGLRKVWEDRMRAIVDEELELMLRRTDAQERIKKERAAATMLGHPLLSFTDLDTSGDVDEPLLNQCRRCVCRQHALGVLNDIRKTFAAQAAHISRIVRTTTTSAHSTSS